MSTKFRFWEKPSKKFIYDIDALSKNPSVLISKVFSGEDKHIIAERFTGLTDKNGVEAFKGDIIRYFSCKRYVQQSFTEVRPEIDEFYLVEKIEVIKDLGGNLNIESNYDENLSCYFKLSSTGFQSVEDIKELFFENQHLDDEEMISDINGNNIDQDKVGFTIIGNIHENPELL